MNGFFDIGKINFMLLFSKIKINSLNSLLTYELRQKHVAVEMKMIGEA